VLTIVALLLALFILPSPWNVIAVVGAAVVDLAETGGFLWWSRRRRRLEPPAVGAGRMVGRGGVALARIGPGDRSPSGQVRVDGEIWNARSVETIDPGTAVTVQAVDGLTLDVVHDRLDTP